MKTIPLKASSLWLAIAALGFLAGPGLQADDDIRVDVVVDATPANQNFPKASPEHPVYYYPWTAGYVELGQILHALKPPPPTWQVQHLIAVALAKKGYLLTHKAHPPAIVLILWWGYAAPVMGPMGLNTGTGSAFSQQSGGMTMVGIGISAGEPYGNGQPGDAAAVAAQHGETAAQYEGGSVMLPAGSVVVTPNDHQMYLMVAGDNFENYIGRDRVDFSTNTLHEAAHAPRYFSMISALDFPAATNQKAKLLWCARVSTELSGRDLADVLPTLIDVGIPHSGEATAGPKFITSALVPAGRVEAGTPVLKATYPAKP